eukprot:7547573-Karenia_brevis.AAC.1
MPNFQCTIFPPLTMVSTEEKIKALEDKHEFLFSELKRWGGLVEKNIGDLRASEAKIFGVESTVKELVNQFEMMGRKDKDGHKGLKKVFGSKGVDLKPEKFEKEKPGATF